MGKIIEFPRPAKAQGGSCFMTIQIDAGRVSAQIFGDDSSRGREHAACALEAAAAAIRKGTLRNQ